MVGREPAFINVAGLGSSVGAAEQHHFARVAVLLQKAFEVFLRAARLGEDERFALRSAAGLHLGQRVEAHVQRLQQGGGFGVGADALRPGVQAVQLGNFGVQALAVELGGVCGSSGRPCFWCFIAGVEDFVQQVFFHFLLADQGFDPVVLLPVGGVLDFLVAQFLQALFHHAQGARNGQRAGRQQLAQHQLGQVALAAGNGVAVFAGQVIADGFIKAVFVVR